MYSLSTLGRRSSGLVRLPLEVLWTRARYISSSERAALDRAKIDSMIRQGDLLIFTDQFKFLVQGSIL